MLMYYMCYFDTEVDDEYCIYVLDQRDVPKLQRIFPGAFSVSEEEAFNYGWTLPSQKSFWVGGFASTRPCIELNKLEKHDIIREAIHATYLALLRFKFGQIPCINKLESEAIDLFI